MYLRTLILTLMCCQGVQASLKPESFFSINGARLSLISNQITHNNWNLQVFRIESSRSVASLLKQFRTQWKFKSVNPHGVAMRQLSPWHIVSSFAPDRQIVLQLQSRTSGSAGYLSIMKLSGSLTARPQHRSDDLSLLPSNTTVISTTISDSDGELQRTLVGTHHLEKNLLQRNWFKKLDSVGWSKLRKFGSGNVVMAMFNRQQERLDVLLLPHNKNSTMLIATHYLVQ